MKYGQIAGFLSHILCYYCDYVIIVIIILLLYGKRAPGYKCFATFIKRPLFRVERQRIEEKF